MILKIFKKHQTDYELCNLLKDFEVILNSDSLNKRISRAKASVIQEAIKAIRELREEARTGVMSTETIFENAMDMK